MCSCINRAILVAVNVLFVVLGAALVGVSLWVILGQNSLFELVKLVTNDVNVDDATLNNYMSSASMLTAAAWVLLGFGGLSLLIGLCGCIGAMKQVSCLLTIYAILVCVILIAEISAAVVAAVFRVRIAEELQPRLKTLLHKHYLPLEMSVNNDKNTSATITSLFNYLHVSLECCGITNVTDITTNNTLWSMANPKYKNRTLAVPVTCCPMMSTKTDLLSKQDWANADRYLVNSECPYTGLGSIQTGCYNKIDTTISTYSLPLIIGGVVIGLCEILCVVMACSLVQKIRNEGKDV